MGCGKSKLAVATVDTTTLRKPSIGASENAKNKETMSQTSIVNEENAGSSVVWKPESEKETGSINKVNDSGEDINANAGVVYSVEETPAYQNAALEEEQKIETEEIINEENATEEPKVAEVAIAVATEEIVLEETESQETVTEDVVVEETKQDQNGEAEAQPASTEAVSPVETAVETEVAAPASEEFNEDAPASVVETETAAAETEAEKEETDEKIEEVQVTAADSTN